jgi:hypothetical protein
MDMARIHPVIEQVDGLPLARAIDAGHDDQQCPVGPVQAVVLRLEQSRAQAALACLVILFREDRVGLRFHEHVSGSGLSIDRPMLRDIA